MIIGNTEISPNDLQNELAKLDSCYHWNALVIFSPTEEQRQFLDCLLTTYINAAPKQRDVIFEAFKKRYGLLNLLLGYVYEAAKQIRLTRNRLWLQTGLAAASIVNALGRMDYRDYLLALAELYVTAEEVGLEPQADFELAGGELADFQFSAVVKERRQTNKLTTG